MINKNLHRVKNASHTFEQTFGVILAPEKTIYAFVNLNTTLILHPYHEKFFPYSLLVVQLLWNEKDISKLENNYSATQYIAYKSYYDWRNCKYVDTPLTLKRIEMGIIKL